MDTMRNLLFAFLAGLAAAVGGCGPAQPVSIITEESLSTSVEQAAWEGAGGGRVLQTQDYRIFTTIQGGNLIATMPGFMEACRRNYLRILRLPDRPAQGPMTIYLLDNRQEWASLTRSLLGDQAGKFLSIEQGGYCYRDLCVFWRIGGTATLSVAAHEGLHQYIHSRLADQLPMWLEEGLCTQAEGYDLRGRTVAFSTDFNIARRGDVENALTARFWIPVDKLLPMDAGDAVGAHTERATAYYGQLWALVKFIRSDPATSAGLDRLIADAEAGRLHQAVGVPPEALAELRLRGRIYNQTVSEPLFRKYISDDLPAFEKRYKEFCMRLTGLK